MWWSNILRPSLGFLFSRANLISPSHSLISFQRQGSPSTSIILGGFECTCDFFFFFLLIGETTVLQIKVFGEEMLCFILLRFVWFQKPCLWTPRRQTLLEKEDTEFIHKHSLEREEIRCQFSLHIKKRSKIFLSWRKELQNWEIKARQKITGGGPVNRGLSSWPASEKKLELGEDRAPKWVQESEGREFLMTSHYVPSSRLCSLQSRMEPGMFPQKKKQHSCPVATLPQYLSAKWYGRASKSSP